MTSTILATFDLVDDAHRAIEELTEMGYKRADIGFALYEKNRKRDVDGAEGAEVGTVAGAIFGALVGLATITIPGVGPVIAAGPLAAAIGALTGAGIGAASGAATGGIVGTLTQLGVPYEETDYYAESLRQGAALVSVTTTESDAARAMHILGKHNPIDVERRISQWRARGWQGYDPKVDPFTAEELSELHGERENSVYSHEDETEHDRAIREYRPK